MQSTHTSSTLRLFSPRFSGLVLSSIPFLLLLGLILLYLFTNHPHADTAASVSSSPKSSTYKYPSSRPIQPLLSKSIIKDGDDTYTGKAFLRTLRHRLRRNCLFLPGYLRRTLEWPLLSIHSRKGDRPEILVWTDIFDSKAFTTAKSTMDQVTA